MNYKMILPFVLSLLLFESAYSQDFFENGKAQLFSQAEIADAGKSNYSISEIVQGNTGLKYRPVKNANENLGFTSNSFWVRFKISNDSSSAVSYYLQTARPITDEVDLYLLKPGGDIDHLISGDLIPFDERAFPHRSSIFKISLPPGETYQAYLHLKSDGEVINLPLTLYTADAFIKTNYRDQIFFGIFYGILLLAAITYLFFYVSLRDVVFLYYGLYVIFIGLLQFALDGFVFQYLLPESGWLNLRAVIIIAILASFFLGRYGETFLNLKEYYKWIPRFFKLIYILLGLTLLALLISPKGLEISYPLANILGLIIFVLIMVSIVKLKLRKVPVDLFFALGIFFLVSGFTIFILNNFSLIPNTFFTEHGAKFGTGLEIIFLSLSMTNRIRRLKTENERMQTIALKKSEEMNEMKSYFMSNMSHELRTPLNAIMGITNALMTNTKTEATLKDLERIKYSSVSLLSLVNDILDFSNIAERKIQLEKSVFSPKELINDIVNNWKIQAHEKDLGFNYTYKDLPYLLIGDEVRLVQIINNILSNSQKFTAEGRIDFNISTERKGAEEILLKLVVTDTGVGIPEDKISVVLNSFTQERLDDKRKFGGLGLGLSIVKSLVDLHEGTLNLTNTGSGTRCQVELPYSIAEEEKPIQLKYSKEDMDLKGAKILVVEDNVINQLVAKKTISLWKNAIVEVVNDGQEALDILSIKSFDIILMDLQMPIMDGYEATKRIRAAEAGAENADIPIIAVTADTTEAAKKKVAEIGMNDYLSKPIESEKLYNRITLQLSKVTSSQ